MGSGGPNPENGPDQIYIDGQPPQGGVHIPETQERRWFEFWRARSNRNTQDVADQVIRNQDDINNQERLDANAINRTERGLNPAEMLRVNTPEEVMELCANITAAQWRERRLNSEYGQGAGRAATAENFTNIQNWFNPGWRAALMAGEFDFQVDRNGEIQRDAWNRVVEIGRRVLRTLSNRQTIATVGIASAVAVFSGGLGIPAAASMIGAVAGRGIGEAWEAFCGRRVRTDGQRLSLRETAAIRDFEEHFKLQQMAEATQAQEITDQERNHRIMNLVNGYHEVNQEVVLRQREQLAEEARWNARRDVCAKIGAMAGLAGGVWLGFQELSRQIMTMDIDTNGVAHLVEKTKNGWDFVYNSIQEAIKATTDALANGESLNIATNAAGQLTHELGSSTWQVIWGAAKNLAPHILQVGAVVGGLFAGRAWEKNHERGAAADFEQGVLDEQHEAEVHRDFIAQQVPGHDQDFANQETAEERWASVFGVDRVPRGNQIWTVNQLGANPVVYRINTVDLNTGYANMTELGPDLQPLVDQNTGENVVVNNYDINILANSGKTKEESVGIWMGQFNKGDQLRLNEVPIQIFDTSNRPVPFEQYRVVKIENNKNVVALRRDNAPDLMVDAFQLAFWGINHYQVAGQVESQAPKAERPLANQVWLISNRNNLPGPIAKLLPATHFAITSVNDTQIQVRNCDVNGTLVDPPAVINIDEYWQQIQNAVTKTLVMAQVKSPAAGGGKGKGKGGNQQQPGNP